MKDLNSDTDISPATLRYVTALANLEIASDRREVAMAKCIIARLKLAAFEGELSASIEAEVKAGDALRIAEADAGIAEDMRAAP